jgi:hypothetical protein
MHLPETTRYAEGARRALAFLPFQPGVKRRGGRQPTGWFGHLMRSGDSDTASRGAQLAAQAGVNSRKTGVSAA